MQRLAVCQAYLARGNSLYALAQTLCCVVCSTVFELQRRDESKT